MKENTQFAKGEKFFLPKALIVEGPEDRKFFISLLQRLKIKDKIYVHEIGGEGNLASEDNRSLKLAASTEAFKKNVKHLVILLDGDGKKQKVFDKIKNKILEINENFSELGFYLSKDSNQIKDFQLPKKRIQKALEIKTFLFLFEENLEKEFLKTLSEKELDVVESCIPKFFECANAEHEEKRVVHAFLSTRKSDFGFARDIGDAASQNLVNFDHDSLKDLRSFLLDFSKL